jgi:hypothetical protein
MVRTKRAQCGSQLDSSTTVVMGACNRRGWLSRWRDPLDQSQRAEDNGLSLQDELILFIFTTFLEITDLVHCAATCRRWRRLLYGEVAAYICHSLQGLGLFGKSPPSRCWLLSAAQRGNTPLLSHNFCIVSVPLAPGSFAIAEHACWWWVV